MKVISIIAATFTGNHGAEAMLTSTIGRIRDQYDNAEFNVFSYYPDDDKKAVHMPWIRVFSASPLYLVTTLVPLSLFYSITRRLFPAASRKMFPKSIVALADSDILIDLAGVSFIDGREKFLPFNILTILPASFVGIPVVKLSQAIGPFNNVINRICAKSVLRRCNKIFARGEQTLANLHKLSAELPVLIAPDVAFLHKLGDSLAREDDTHVQNYILQVDLLKNTGSTVVGICPSSLVADKAACSNIDYVHLLYIATKSLIKEGSVVLIFPNSTREGKDTTRNNDLPVIAKLVTLLESDESCKGLYRSFDKNITNDGVKRILMKCDVVITSRFHAMVGALTLGIPVLVLGWGHKYLEVLKQFGQETWAWDWCSGNAEMFIEKMNLLVSRHKIEKAHIQSRIDDIKVDAGKQIDYVFEVLNNSAD